MARREMRAIVQIAVKGAPKMPQYRRREVAQWLRRQADTVEKSSDKLASMYRASLEVPVRVGR